MDGSAGVRCSRSLLSSFSLLFSFVTSMNAWNKVTSGMAFMVLSFSPWYEMGSLDLVGYTEQHHHRFASLLVSQIGATQTNR